MRERVTVTECPRDAMQGISRFIPTENKIRYVRKLLEAGFDVLDFGSFVSPEAVPQMADSEALAEALAEVETVTRLLAIVGNVKGAERAARFSHIRYLGFPFSVSPTFLARNIRSNPEDAWNRLLKIRDQAVSANQEVVAYISMAFGNPYGDPWSPETVAEWVHKMVKEGIRHIALSDTVGEAVPEDIFALFSTLTAEFPEIRLGAHFHTRPDNWMENVNAAWEGGCRSFDAAIRGLGGCPMARDQLTGNLPTENLLRFLEEKNAETGIHKEVFEDAWKMAALIFPGE